MAVLEAQQLLAFPMATTQWNTSGCLSLKAAKTMMFLMSATLHCGDASLRKRFRFFPRHWVIIHQIIYVCPMAIVPFTENMMPAKRSGNFCNMMAVFCDLWERLMPHFWDLFVICHQSL